jgi:ribonuclease VapC
MVVDSSVLVAIVLREPGAEAFLSTLLDRDETAYVGTVTAFEAALVLARRLGAPGLPILDGLMNEIEFEIVPFDGAQIAAARAAYLRFGKGRHPAKLNLGDCCAYALAKTLRQPLLCKGRDFSRTDIARVDLRPA